MSGMTTDQPAPSPENARGSALKWICLAGCALMLSIFAVLAWTSVQTKSPVVDEPLDVLGSVATTNLGDFRVNYEDPPLWHYWAAIPQGDVTADLNQTSEWWPKALE